jgi:uncharacterized OB-fold protein
VSGEAPTPERAALKHVLREMGPAAREFYRRLAEGELATTGCDACALLSFPPRQRCPRCSHATSWRSLARRGRVYAFTQQERGLRFLAPDTIGIVELEEGVRVFGVFDDPFERLAIGLPVEVEPRADSGGLTLLRFKLRAS